MYNFYFIFRRQGQDRGLGKIFVDKIYTPQATQILSYINFIN